MCIRNAIAVAVAEGNGGDVRFFGEIVNTSEALDKLVKQLSKAGAFSSRFVTKQAPVGTAFTGNCERWVWIVRWWHRL
jgi:hypothetical protein